ncbi:hypothetical protein [Marinospirillum perlucidum]|uniref:hypothetical protein n=1 Tax=Marinospirillum perlucidum TaxID=1982602 RepID=UPI000DF17F74|nr:hypothetical protein [Marinospirillum perlucidum]
MKHRFPLLLLLLSLFFLPRLQAESDRLELVAEETVPGTQEQPQEGEEEKAERQFNLLAADPEDMTPEQLEEEIQLLKNLQAGMQLTLAACEDEPHCVTAFTDQEIERITTEIQLLTEALENKESRYDGLISQLQEVGQTYARLRSDFQAIAARIDRESLEGNWADQFVFDDFDIGPDVPYPNEHVTLNMFEDAHKPLPIE